LSTTKAEITSPRRSSAANHARLGYRRVRQKRGFHLDRADAVSGNLGDFVGAASEPDVAVVVALR